MSTAYPTWKRIDAKHWESEERLNGVPDFVATKEKKGWRLKTRSSANTQWFATMTAIKDYTRGAYR